MQTQTFLPAAGGKSAADPIWAEDVVGKQGQAAEVVGDWEHPEEFVPILRGEKKPTRTWKKHPAEPHVWNFFPCNELLVLPLLGMHWNVSRDRTRHKRLRCLGERSVMEGGRGRLALATPGAGKLSRPHASK